MAASVTLTDVSLDIPIYALSSRNIKGSVMRLIRRTEEPDTAWIRALDGVNLSLKDGDRIGLIGPNGAGKTTLLRVMSGILTPTVGSVAIQGEVAAMFDLGLGMSIEATGRENILMRGMVLGHTRAEMKEMVDSIADFADIGDRINHPVRTYSSGMIARLSFSIATAIHPQILLLDEGIGMADAAFTNKARDRMNDFMRRAGILILASHSESLLRDFCDQAVVLDRGRVTFHGPVDEAMRHYKLEADG